MNNLITYDQLEKGWADEHLTNGSKVFISLPMGNREATEVRNKMHYIFNQFVEYTGRDDLVMIDQYVKAVPLEIRDTDRQPIWCLGDSVKLMSFAGIVIFSEDYWHAKGCLAEHYLCKEYNIPFTYESCATLQMAPHNCKPGSYLVPDKNMVGSYDICPTRPSCDS